jgi:PEP-CTERM motif
MKTKQLFIPMMFIGACIAGTTSTGAAIISFSEPLTGIAPIAVITDIVGATITTSVEKASLSLGDTSGQSTVLLKRAMVNQGTGTGEGGGMGVSDILELDSFTSDGEAVGFLATFQSDPSAIPERGIPTPPDLTLPNIREDGTLQLLTPADFTAPLTRVGAIALAVSARSDAVEGAETVPEPTTWAMMLLGFAGLACLGWRRGAKQRARARSSV